MAKELVISSNRHETKVAVLEDDQLVEIYFQRAHEYSLAGSIHKGRVTRVLPGMQSAFVDLGLERDTFLYVSDFFDENAEEYDRIPTDDRSPRSRASSAGAAVAETPVSERAAPSATVEANAPVDPPTEVESRGVHDRDRRNRRSKRRRGRERGLPESKYAAVGEQPPADADSAVDQPKADFEVLPGESLAKYARPEAAETETESDAEEQIAEAESSGTEDQFEEAEESPEESGATPSEPLTEYEESEIREMILEAQEEAERREQGFEEPEASARSLELAPTVETGGESLEACPEEEEEAPEPEEEELLGEEDSTAPETEEAAGEEPSEPKTEGEPEQEIQEAMTEAAQAESAAMAEPGLEEETPGIAVDSREIEPARKPVSLTATLREQGHRYLHRVSRRMRRKLRQEAAAAEQQREAQTEPKAARAERPTPSITDLLREGQEIIVQIAKEPLGQKGARITSHIALPGRYVVYMPTVEHIGVSRKIASEEERQRLKRILQAHRVGAPGGFIVRTAGEGRSEQEITADMNFLVNLWQDIKQKAEKRKAPALLHHDLDIVQRVLRDQLTESFKSIWTDNEEVYESVLRFVQRFQPGLMGRVKLYTRSTPIFDAFNITQELEKALRPKVWLKSGGYIVINQTEALVAIDVNTGKFVGKSNRLEDTIVKTNTEAVKEIVRQIRLRDLGGIIVIDFIDMDERKNRQKVMQALEEAMRADRAPYKILQFNDFGLVAITRKRVKQSLERTLCSPCPYCDGAGYVKSVQTVIGEILQEATKIAKAVEGEKDVILRVNPEVAKVLKSTDNSYLEELESILKRPVLVQSDPMLHQEKFDLA